MSGSRNVAKPGLVQASGVLFAMLMAGNLLNYAFHAVASRRLGPAEYGALVTMLALLTVLAVPSQAIQTVIAKRVAVEELTRGFARIALLTRQALWRAGLLGLAGALVILLGGSSLRDFFRMSSLGPLWAAAGTVVVMLAIPVARGVLQGLQQFGHLGANTLADNGIRLGAGTLALTAGWGVTGGVLASAAGAGAALLLAWVPLRWLSGEGAAPDPDLDWGTLYRYLLPVIGAFGSFLLVSSLDLLLVKHWFEPEAAGYYAAGSMVGKAFLFLPLAVAQVLFPKVSAGAARAENTRRLLGHSLTLTAVVLLAGVAVAWMFAPWIVWTLFGRAFLNPLTLQLIRGFGLVMTPLALVYILVQYHLAVHSTRLLVLLLADIPLLALAILWWHADVRQVLWVVGINHAVVFVTGYLLTPKLPGCTPVVAAEPTNMPAAGAP